MRTVDQMIAVLQAWHVLHRVTQYVSPKVTIKVTRRGKPDRRERQETFLVTIGRPNFAEKLWIKKYLAAGEDFPIKRLQFKWYRK